jgi:putative membrane protein
VSPVSLAAPFSFSDVIGRPPRHTMTSMIAFLIHTVVLGIAIWVTARIVPGISIASPSALALAALVLGLVNAIIRPVLVILTLPITVITLGLFYLVVNGAAFALAARLVPGFSVGTWTAAILGALLTSVISWAIGVFVRRD